MLHGSVNVPGFPAFCNGNGKIYETQVYRHCHVIYIYIYINIYIYR